VAALRNNLEKELAEEKEMQLKLLENEESLI